MRSVDEFDAGVDSFGFEECAEGERRGGDEDASIALFAQEGAGELVDARTVDGEVEGIALGWGPSRLRGTGVIIPFCGVTVQNATRSLEATALAKALGSRAVEDHVMVWVAACSRRYSRR